MRMRSRTIEWIITIVIFLLIIILAIVGLQQKDRQILTDAVESPEFTAAERHYLKEHDTVRIAVTEDLEYLTGDGGRGYLPEYLETVLAPAGLEPVFLTGYDRSGTSGLEEADCTLEVVTPQVRASMDERGYTAPLFQVEGRMFVREDGEAADPMKVLVLSDRMTDARLSALSYRDKKIAAETAKTMQELIEGAKQPGTDGLIGDFGSTQAALLQAGLQNVYLPSEKALYHCNACILVDDSEAILRDILNQCIHSCDRHNLSYEMSNKWLNGSGPLFMEQTQVTSFIPALIVILSVLIAFFMYYLTNRSMYQELNDRMDRITESRNEMQTTFHGVGYYMAELSTGGEIMDLNRAFAEDLKASALHRRIWDVLELDEDGLEHVRQMVQHAAEGKQDPRYETNIGKKTFVIDVFPVEGARGEVGQLLFMAIDVTEERMAKRQMLQDNKMIAIGQLAAGVAHEIRNPLGIIRNYCYVLKTMEDEEIRAKAIEEIENAVEVSGGIINELLDFSRISPGRVEMIDVEEHIRTLLSLNEAAFRTGNIEFEIVCPEPVRTYIAREPFDMILLNLVKNASDAIAAKQETAAEAGKDEAEEGTSDAAGRITITILRTGEDAFTIDVTDTGTGIPEEALEEVFNPFFTTKGNQGTGLGLYIVYSETEKLEGEIDVSSRIGEGTTFHLSLPVKTQPEKEEV